MPISDTFVRNIEGLPVSDSDHGLNGLEFGDNGELYILVGSNTNGGVPGQLTGKQVQKDNYYSSSAVVAYLADPLFDGTITYDADDDGTPNGGNGIDVFAAGLRNSFGIVLHSNGNLYATDNGPNFGTCLEHAHVVLYSIDSLCLTFRSHSPFCCQVSVICFNRAAASSFLMCTKKTKLICLSRATTMVHRIENVV